MRVGFKLRMCGEPRMRRRETPPWEREREGKRLGGEGEVGKQTKEKTQVQAVVKGGGGGLFGEGTGVDR